LSYSAETRAKMRGSSAIASPCAASFGASSALLERDDGVLERRLVLAGRDRLDLGALFGHALLECRRVMLVAHLVERGHLVRQRALGVERVRVGSGLRRVLGLQRQRHGEAGAQHGGDSVHGNTS